MPSQDCNAVHQCKYLALSREWENNITKSRVHFKLGTQTRGQGIVTGEVADHRTAAAMRPVSESGGGADSASVTGN